VLKQKGIIGKEEGTKVAVEKASRKDIIEVVTASGKVFPDLELKISPDVSGEIVQLTVQEGDSVSKGQLLAMVYADIYATQRDQAEPVSHNRWHRWKMQVPLWALSKRGWNKQNASTTARSNCFRKK
jgi:hypothetical protein